MFPSPIAGNQTFTNVVNLAGQLPLLNVSQLEASHASAVTGDITGLTYGDDPVRTTVFGVLTIDTVANFYSFLDKSTGEPLVLPENTEVFSLQYISPLADFSGAAVFDIGLGEVAAGAINVHLVMGGMPTIANNGTGGYVQGTLSSNNPQSFGGTGGSGTRSRTVPAAPDNEMILERLGGTLTGTLEITMECVVRRDQL